MSERLLFLIPARGGSKGLPGKNVLEVGGIPLVGRAARLGCATARVVGSGSRVVCSTDDSAIADAARAWGAEVPFVRPAHLSSDGARSIDVVFHALDVLEEEFDAVVLLQPTSPLTAVSDVVGALDLFREYDAPVVSMCRAEHPAEWFFTLDDGGRLSPLLSRDEIPIRRQQARDSFRPNGAVYVAHPDTLRANASFVGPQTRGFVMPAARSIDIDTAQDLQLARVLMASRERSGATCAVVIAPMPPRSFPGRHVALATTGGEGRRAEMIARDSRQREERRHEVAERGARVRIGELAVLEVG